MPNETTEEWQDRMNWIINGHLTIGRGNIDDPYAEWLTEDDQINMRQNLKVFIRNLLKAEREKAQKEVIYSLTDWLRQYANRPLADRKDPFTEVVELQTELKKKFNLN